MSRTFSSRPHKTVVRVALRYSTAYKRRPLHGWTAMIIICPNCSTRYSIDPGSLGNMGKPVRCSNCQHTWHQEPNLAAPP
ncbi:MAG TPA: hypothetical protein ENI72_02540, partial [Rhodospirillales bacterium]|nr:hypothetical protein [Rhodospirillales bacterium]